MKRTILLIATVLIGTSALAQNGVTPRRKAAESVYQHKDSAAYVKACEDFRKAYPINEWYADRTGDGWVYVNFYRSYASFLYKHKMYDKLCEVMPEMEFSMIADLYGHGPLWLIQKAPIDPREYVDISRDMIDVLWSKRHDNISMYGDDSPKTQRDEDAANYYVAVETEILYRSGLRQEAIDMMERIPMEDRFNMYPAGNEAYALALLEEGRRADSDAALIGSAGTGLLTPKMFAMLRGNYNAMDVKPAPTFDNWYASLKTGKAVENMMAHVKLGLMSVDVAPFRINSIDGEIFNLAEMAPGHITVIDFWATWCAPCIAALSGMQLAVEKYLGDPTVSFLFIDTLEEYNAESVKRIWNRGKYHDMTPYFDTKKSGVYRSIIKGTSSIPQKAIIKDGKVRYIAEGYGGSPSGLMDEISAVIEILKNEK